MANFLYQSLVDWFQKQLAEGALSAGDRMPSLRKVAKEQGISLNTAIHGYELLSQEGWIEARPKSGYFICHRSKLRPAMQLASDLCRELEPQASLDMNLRLRYQNAVLTQYSPLMGTELLSHANQATPMYGKGQLAVRQALSQYLKAVGIQAQAESLWLGRSALGLLTQVILSLTAVGSKVLLITPCDLRLSQTLLDLGRVPVCLAAGEHGVDLDVAEDYLKKTQVSLVILPGQFAFPTGQAISNLTLRRWLALLDEVEVSAVEWDMCSQLSYHGSHPMAYKSLDSQNRIIYIGAFEGIYRTGGQLAWCLANAHKPILDKAFFSADFCPDEEPQQALLWLFEQGAGGAYSRLSRALWAKSEKIKAHLESVLADQMCAVQAKGGACLWLQITQPLTEEFWSAYQMSHYQSLLPGRYVSHEPEANEWLVLNLSGEDLQATVDWLVAQLSQTTEAATDTAAVAPTSPTKQASTVSEPLYNPMLDLINHDFG